MSARRVILWVVVAVIVLGLIAVGVGLFYRGGFGTGIAYGIMRNGRFFNTPRGYGMMPGVGRAIGFPFLGWIGSLLIFGFGLLVGLLLGGIGRSNQPRRQEGPDDDKERAAFEAWHREAHEHDPAPPAAKRGRRSQS
jgi:hypothetical protein